MEICNLRPTDLRPLPPVKMSQEPEIQAVVARARAAQPSWADQSFNEKLRLMKAAGKELLVRRQEVLELLYDEIGKNSAEALLSEAVGPLQYMSDWARVARPWLKPRKLAVSPLAFPGKSGKIEMLPRGIVGIIAPWNFPLGNFFKPVFPALLCGNAVVLKPSEYSPRTAEFFVRIMNRHLPEGVLNLVQGDKAAGQALIRSGIDAVTFTGSFRSGKEVAKLAAEQMIPCSLELGGKDAAIVLSDCQLDRTAAGVAYWALHNSGQACGAIERVYVEEGIADAFVARLSEILSKPGARISTCANSAQLAIVEDHIWDAVENGAKLLAGGERMGSGLGFTPALLDHCKPSMKVMVEPTFGPVIAVMRVKNSEEALRLANACDYGLNASVWSRDLARAESIARKLQVGTAYVNNHAFTGAMPAAPWTGVKNSGCGIANSAFALQHYTRPRTLAVDRKKTADAWWFPMDASAEELGHRLAEAQLGVISSALRLPFLISKRQRVALRPEEWGQETHVSSRIERPLLGKIFFPLNRLLSAVFHSKMSERELAWGRSALETIFSAPGDQAPSSQAKLVVSRGEADAFLQDLYAHMRFPAFLALRLTFWLIAFSPFPMRRKLTTFDRLPLEERLSILESLSKSRIYIIRQFSLLLKMNGALLHSKTSRIQGVKPAPTGFSGPEGHA